MRAPWLDRMPGEETLAQRALAAPLVPLSWLYGAAAATHRALYERETWPREQADCAVVSVGGLAAGGCGKTPLAAWLARALRGRGHAVALLSRGYARRSRGVVVVSDGARICASADEAGDEALWLAASAPGVPVVVAERRSEAAALAVERFGTQVAVLDDGFQHHRLARDVDIVCVEAERGVRLPVLPRGVGREPHAALRRADVVVAVDGALGDRDLARLARVAPAAQLCAAERRPGLLRRWQDGAALEVAGKPVGLFCGLGSPRSLRRSAEALGARVVAERHFADHHRYRERDLRGLAEQAACWITTEKDAPKLRRSWLKGVELGVLGLHLEVRDAEALLGVVEARLAR